MKQIILVFTFCLIVFSAYGQKKKSVQMHKIKSTTVYNEDSEKTKGKAVLDFYTKYDESGNTIEEIEYDANGKIKSHMLYEYDDDGNKTKEIFLNPDGTKDKVIEYKYSEGLRVERITYLPNGKIKSKKKYVYDFH